MFVRIIQRFFYAIAILIFLIALGLRLVYLEQRADLHIDEGLSIVLSEYNDYGWGKFYPEGTILDAHTLKEKLLWNDATISGALNDIFKLWKNNRDIPHTNLYYSLFRLWHIGFADNEIKSLFYRGVSLNFVFFILSFCFAFCLVKKLLYAMDSDSDKTLVQIAILVFLSLSFLNPASITNTLFMRPYMLQECLLMMFLWANTNLFCCLQGYQRQGYFANNVFPKELRKQIWRLSFLLVVLTSFFLLSGYFGALFVCMVFITCGVYVAVYIKRYIYIYITLASLVLTPLLYPKYFRGFLKDRGVEARQKISLEYLSDSIGSITESFFTLLYTHLGLLLSILLLCSFVWFCVQFIKAKSLRYIMQNNLIVFYSLCALVWMFLVIFVAPYKTLRYIMPAFPVLLLCVPYLLCYLREITITKTRSYLLAICISCVVLSNVLYLSLYGNRVENIAQTVARQIALLEQKTSDSLVAISIQESANYAILIPHITAGHYMFFHNCAKLQESLSNPEQKFAALIIERGTCKNVIQTIARVSTREELGGLVIFYFSK
ncbi:hypothetical protein CQA66_03050 [Helicobacter aurati]|uniref:PI-PLC Y-box domain-containing protein n=1 Tax=Helicobacter aurati TaxID=137778 RepID=A0A3D8J6H5_9HELI|nr:hypothetical protein [Helicobacter aurati]RDU72880.1 hypothetical protein CQA66_03050 [Helicobacter aurati]